jgi:uncharacterized protein
MRHGVGRTLRRAAVAPAILLIRVYQATISPILPPACRYTPSCSQYFIEALRKWGFARGSWLGVRRLLRCHPFHAGGYDPVPDPAEPRD